MKKMKWYEIWCDEGLSPPYVLIVRNDIDKKDLINVIDPLDNNRIIFSSNDYADVKYYLLEDEYIMVNGRMEIE